MLRFLWQPFIRAPRWVVVSESHSSASAAAATVDCAAVHSLAQRPRYLASWTHCETVTLPHICQVQPTGKVSSIVWLSTQDMRRLQFNSGWRDYLLLQFFK